MTEKRFKKLPGSGISLQEQKRRPYSGFDSSVGGIENVEWLFPQEKSHLGLS
jgi:hypothetical protein